ncbi:hypothetical protein [Wolbachia endosymbiont (group A) of Scambus nigricans]|uniref:hypothetical protein n=1 Tax=Wolbachia endosymbiont (group A) of Scambus nigricans TaxID=2954055 RepID=UPI00222F4B0F|nr:hypothetical protein [Wolbachia endosymbiont (group A) of Scambus nigricans]
MSFSHKYLRNLPNKKKGKRSPGVIALFTIIRTDRNMLLACYSHKHISYRIRTIIRKAILSLSSIGIF